MDTSAKPDDPDREKSTAPETTAAPAPSRRDFYATTVLATLLMALFGWLGGYLLRSGGYGDMDNFLIGLIFAVTLAGVGGGVLLIFLARRGRPVAVKLTGLFFLFIWSFIALPGVVPAKIASNESFTIGSLKNFATAQEISRKNTGAYAYPFSNLRNLPETRRWIDSEMAAADRPDAADQGYYFMHGNIRAPSPDSFDIFATPVRYGRDGVNTYFIDQRGVILMKDLRRSLTPEEALTIDASNWDVAQ